MSFTRPFGRAARCPRRPRRLLLTAAVLLAAAVAPDAASAQSPAQPLPPSVRFAVGSAPMLAAQSIARDTWGTDACGGQVTVTWDVLAPNYNAQSTWTNPFDSYADPLANYGCTIELNTSMTFDWPKFCTVVVHEYGHLDGQQHSPDPRSVMAAIYGGPLAACAAMPEPGAVPAPVVAAPAAKVAAKTKRTPEKKRATKRKAAQRTSVR